MAFSITIGSLALAADGKTLTGTLAGGTGTGYAVTDQPYFDAAKALLN